MLTVRKKELWFFFSISVFFSNICLFSSVLAMSSYTLAMLRFVFATFPLCSHLEVSFSHDVFLVFLFTLAIGSGEITGPRWEDDQRGVRKVVTLGSFLPCSCYLCATLTRYTTSHAALSVPPPPPFGHDAWKQNGQI